ncbi:MAG: glycosyltransferase [Thermoanaerobaculales bacterium]|jgi:glycosyltransferase involved in cell wall biosynthesis|nr:glycosyltransferase [Thermoanaerobaculales bacterium]
MAHPSVSVLLPVRDAAPWLEAALASLARQSLRDHEVVAVDDGSRDGSAVILDRWSAADPRLRVVRQPPLGLVPALERGLAECRAALVARMDADDVSHPRRLELQAALLAARPEVGVVGCLVRHFPAGAVGEGARLYETWLNSLADHRAMARERFVESPVAHPAVMVRRAVLEDAGGWRDLGWPEDYDLWLRLFDRGVGFATVERPLLFWREHPARLTRTDPRYSVASFLACKAHHLARGPLAGPRRVILWGAGRTGRRLAALLLAEGVAIDAVVDIDPAKIGGALRGRPVIAPGDLPARLGDDVVVLAAVASRGARDLIRGRLVALGLVEGRGFWCVA